MKTWTSRRIVVCLLGIMLSAGMTLSAVQANGMTVDMALAGDMTPSGNDDCGGCGDDAAYTGGCHSVCASSVFIMSASAKIARLPAPAPSTPCGRVALYDAAVPPDPYPPRPTFLI